MSIVTTAVIQSVTLPVLIGGAVVFVPTAWRARLAPLFAVAALWVTAVGLSAVPRFGGFSATDKFLLAVSLCALAAGFIPRPGWGHPLWASAVAVAVGAWMGAPLFRLPGEVVPLASAVLAAAALAGLGARKNDRAGMGTAALIVGTVGAGLLYHVASYEAAQLAAALGMGIAASCLAQRGGDTARLSLMAAPMFVGIAVQLRFAEADPLACTVFAGAVFAACVNSEFRKVHLAFRIGIPISIGVWAAYMSSTNAPPSPF